MKVGDTQESHYQVENSTVSSKDSTSGDVSKYQSLLDKLVAAIVATRLLESTQITEEYINSLLQFREYQLCMTNDWNLDCKTGYDYALGLLSLSGNNC
jgi:hypothetical protein